MTKLSPDARDLIEAARAGEGPPAQARERVRARVLARVGAGAAVGSAAALGSTSSAAQTAISTGLLFKLAAGVGVAGVLAIVAAKAGVLPGASSGPRAPAVTLPASPVVRRGAAGAAGPPCAARLRVAGALDPGRRGDLEGRRARAVAAARPRARAASRGILAGGGDGPAGEGAGRAPRGAPGPGAGRARRARRGARARRARRGAARGADPGAVRGGADERGEGRGPALPRGVAPLADGGARAIVLRRRRRAVVLACGQHRGDREAGAGVWGGGPI